MKRLSFLFLLATCAVPSIAGSKPPDAQPDLARRFRAQAAIEQIYWRHRIWPDVNPGAKPPLRAPTSEGALRGKALDALRKSAALGALWNRPIAAAALQAEIDRMVRDTHSPGMLRELFAALDDDPVLIAEVLARPLVADRLIRRFYARDDRVHGAVRQRAENAVVQADSIEDLVRAGGVLVKYEAVLASEASEGDADAKSDPGARMLEAAEWRALLNRLAGDLGEAAPGDGMIDPRALPRGHRSPLQEDETRFYTTVVLDADATSVEIAEVAWPKQSFDEWWRSAAMRFGADLPDTSGPYVLPALPGTSCTVGTWTPLHGWTPPTRDSHTAVWTGSEMLVWGGTGPADGLGRFVGGRYDPATDTWSVMAAAGSPGAQSEHTAVWTGTRMIVWGGTRFGGNVGPIGGVYDPITDSWTPTRSDATAPDPRTGHTAVWTGSRMVVWGGHLLIGSGATTGTGGRYDPATDTWLPTRADATAPQPRSRHTAVWTGSRMIVWGGDGDGTYPLPNQSGGRYDPVNDTWEPTRLDATTPGARAGHIAMWTGTRMVVWGGYQRTVPGSPNATGLTSGAQYDPIADAWQPTRNDGTQPPVFSIRNAAWTGLEWLLWGYGQTAPYTPIGRRYDPATDLWHPMSTTGAPSPRIASSAVWTGGEMIVWGGIASANGAHLNTGGRYDPASDTWVATAVDQASPISRFDASAVWTGSEMIVWGGTENDVVKTGHRYDPATDSWQPIRSDATAPEARSRHTAVWTGTEMIVWGGEHASGGRYNPASDSWLPTRLDGSTPAARALNTTVWTGTEMIVWGGSTGSVNLKTGGRYRPDTDAWIPTRNDATTPSARNRHSAVWTGQRMIVWGGSDVAFSSAVNTGSRYDPVSDTWTPTRADVSTPPARQSQAAVWTGSRMVIWGGVTAAPFTSLQSGGRYDPVADTWVSTALNSPSARAGHSAQWTGTEMIIWGGSGGTGLQNSGGRYEPVGNTWILIPADATTPVPRENHVSVLSGNGLLVWGGQGQVTSPDYGGEYCLCSPAATWYRDLDGDGFGTAASIVTSCQQPAGYVPAAGDCNDGDSASWSTPGEALDLMFDDETHLHWSPPASPGSNAITYDVLRSDSPGDFVGPVVCLASDVTSPMASDEESPPSGDAVFYRVRARNGCPGGVGLLGTDSAGAPVAGRACP